MKKISKKILVVSLVLCLVFAMCACSGGSSADDEAALKAAVESLNAVKSMSYDMDMTMGMAVGEESLDVVTKTTAKTIVEPLTMEMEMSMDMGEAGTQDMKMFAETVDGVTNTYTEVSGSWIKQELGDISELQNYDAAQTMNMYISAMKEFKNTGSDTINGSKAAKYEGVITEEYFNDVMESSGALSQLGLSGADEETMKNLFKGVGDLPIAIWLDDATGFPVKYDMDMTAMMQAMMKNLMEGQEGAEDLVISKMQMSMVITGYDNVDKIEIPDEARNAKAM